MKKLAILLSGLLCAGMALVASAADPLINLDFANGAGDVELVEAEIVEDATRGNVLQINGAGQGTNRQSYGLYTTGIFENNSWENGLTVSMWIKTAEGSTTLHGTAPIFSIDIANIGYISVVTSLESAINTDGNDTSLGISPRCWNDPVNIGGGQNLTEEGVWQMMTVTYSPDGMKLYMDGELYSEPVINTGTNDDFLFQVEFAYALRLGSWLCDWWNYGDYEGLIDDVLVYNTALSADEVSALYTSTKLEEVAASATTAPAATATDSVEPTILWDFNADEEMSAVMSGANAVSYFGDTVDGVECYEFIASGNDPYVSVNISADDAENVQWAKVRVKNPSYATAIEFFGATGGRSLTGSECTHVELKTEDDTWYTYLIYVPDENVKTVNAYKDPQYAITEPYWAGTVEYIRLDPLWREGDDGSDAGGNMVGGENIYIDYVAFFPTKEAALAFRPELDNYAFPEQGPAAVEAPVEEAPVEEVVETPVEEVAPVEEVVEAPAEEVAPVEEVVEEAPVVEEVVEEVAPQTFDFGVIAAVTAVLSLAGFAVSKKR